MTQFIYPIHNLILDKSWCLLVLLDKVLIVKSKKSFVHGKSFLTFYFCFLYFLGAELVNHFERLQNRSKYSPLPGSSWANRDEVRSEESNSIQSISMDKGLFNVILLGMSFFLIFTAFQTAAIIQVGKKQPLKLCPPHYQTNLLNLFSFFLRPLIVLILHFTL